MQWHYLKIIVSVIFIFNCSLLYADDLDTQRDIFIRAEHALKNKNYSAYERLAQKITSYPLYPYLLYEDLKLKIKSIPPNPQILAALEKFERDYPDFPFARKLRDAFLQQTAKRKNWSLYVNAYRNTDNAELNCYHVQAKYFLGNDQGILEQTKKLWLVGHSQPNACNDLFKIWDKTAGIPDDLVWGRFKLAVEEKNFQLSEHLSRLLSQGRQTMAKYWLKIAKNPYHIMSKKDINTLEASKLPELMVFGIPRLAKQDPEKARAFWQANKNHYAFTPGQIREIQTGIAQGLAHQKHPDTLHWLSNMQENQINPPLREWRVRLSIFKQDWRGTLKWIEQLPRPVQEEKSWQYWKARALEKLNQPNEARDLYAALAKERNYYGFLASLRLKKPITLQNHEPLLDPVVYQRVLQYNPIKRFLQLMLLGRTSVARTEWYRALDGMNEKERIALAKVAQRLKLHDLAIYTMSKAEFRDDVNLRFPLAHDEEIISNAREHNLDPAWIFAVARQESGFYTEAVSTAGARGLMQLLPTTAKEMAKKHQIPYPSDAALHHPKTNLKLGTVYLKNLKQRMQNHHILATASYNAGPTRILNWLPDKDLEADIWIENIPYRETREYVKNVMTFTSIYRQRLGFPSSFALMMKTIPAKNH